MKNHDGDDDDNKNNKIYPMGTICYNFTIYSLMLKHPQPSSSLQ